jgi:signal transduction histidine kinase
MKPRPSLSAVLLAAALPALLLLATLQYSWVGQLSAGDLARRQADLALAAERLGEEFDRELARAYLALQMDAATLRDSAWDRYARRIDRWEETAPHPALIESIYLVQVSQFGRVGLARYSQTTRTFERVSWPSELVPIRRRLERAFRSVWSEGASGPIDLNPVERTGPSLLIPVARPWLLSSQEQPGIDADLLYSDLVLPRAIPRCASCPPEFYDSPLLAHTLVVLDHDYITQAYLPALAQRFFSAGRTPEFNLGVVDQSDASRLIYSSDPRLGAASYGVGDASVGILGISYDELNALILTGDPRLDGSASSPTERVVIGVLGRQGEGDPAVGAWRLVLKHHQGSLDAAVAALRTRNLLVSFGILLLLAVSMALLLLSTRRAQRLAHQQLAFASAVSHELRTPIAVIRSAGENLADGLVADDQQARRYGAVISNEGRRLTEMVEQVLAFAAAQSGQQRYALERTEPLQLIDGAVQRMQAQLRDGGYQLELTVAPDLPAVSADPEAMRRALQNLISNAMKYGGEDGWIGLDARLAPGEQELLISVRDRGPGIDPADLPHIFEPFYRGHAARAAQAAGSGLGLSLVRHTVAGHGGRVGVESHPESGTAISILLPVARAAALAVPLAEAS